MGFVPFPYTPEQYASAAAAVHEMAKLLYPTVEVIQSFDDLKLNEQIVAPIKPTRLLEIGVFKGGSTLLWMWLCPPGTTIISVDIDPQWDADLLMALAIVRGQSLHLVKGDSLAVDTKRAVQDILSEKMLDVLYIDSTHEATHLACELRDYAPLLREGGAHWASRHCCARHGRDHQCLC